MSGLLALGDSITRGRGGEPALGVHPLSWAQWLAEAMGLAYLSLAEDGARAADLVRSQLPQASAVRPSLHPMDGHEGRAWDVATLYIGVNDARSVDFDPAGFARDVGAAAERLAEVAARVVMLTIPLDLGRPRAGEDVVTANAIIRRAASDVGAVVVALEDFGGPLWVLPDAVHPTSLGMVAIADRAAAALGAPRRPSEVAGVSVTARKLVRYWPWYGRLLVKDWRRRFVESRA